MSLGEQILNLILSKSIVYLREVQVLLENPPDIEHWHITSAIWNLHKEKKIKTRVFNGLRWFYLHDSSWSTVRPLVVHKSQLVKYYLYWNNVFVSAPEGIRYDDYSEYLVEQALTEAGLTIAGRNTNYFNGREYRKQGTLPGRPPDLDFIALNGSVNKAIGVSVKNKLSYPTDAEITALLEICEVLQVKPVLVTRMVFGRGIQKVYEAGGRTVIFKRWLLRPEMPNNIFVEMSDTDKSKSVLGLPISIYRYVPKWLVGKCQTVRNELFVA